MASRLIHIIITASVLLLLCQSTSGQSNNKLIRDGNKLYHEGDFEASMEKYDKVLERNDDSEMANFNKGTAQYKLEDYEKAIERFTKIISASDDNEVRSKAYHNLGNSFMESDKLDESIEAYKDALRLNPNDDEARYNLAYALNKKEEQEQQDQDQQNKDQDNKTKEQEKENQDQQQNQESEQEQSEEQKGEQQPREQELTKEEAERILRALEENEKKTRKKVEKAKVRSRGNNEKDW